ncbi:UNVERIFIED_CONTAM: hypothetical protein Sradi_1153000 [Sesamum radiatum]|uniref:Reverse transcriptase/retrotransposon-derived protein RNase H-like domain-containing protein n=1 Tax=Sesamum radiatum TaxID=300843 RepID=A0AAW2UKF0_SESRA
MHVRGPRRKVLGVHGLSEGDRGQPEKIEAIINMQPPGTTKEVQKLTGRIAALNRFISRSSDKGLPFFKILKKADAFSWNEQCQAAFENLKKYLTSPPLLTKPKPGETLFLYLAISEGATEVTNRIILQSLKTRLEEAKGNWVDELPGVLWAYRTTPRRSTRESPFSLVYGTEAVVPVEIGEETLRVQQYEPASNNSERRADLDLIQELRHSANARTTAYKAMMAKAYNSKVRHRGFQVGDLVLRRADATKNLGKLDAKWEGPYQVTEVIGSGTYKLHKMDGKEIPRTWNIANLKKYFA